MSDTKGLNAYQLMRHEDHSHKSRSNVQTVLQRLMIVHPRPSSAQAMGVLLILRQALFSGLQPQLLSACRVLAEASAELCACDVPHRAVVASASDADALLTAVRCAGIEDLQASLRLKYANQRSPSFNIMNGPGRHQQLQPFLNS